MTLGTMVSRDTRLTKSQSLDLSHPRCQLERNSYLRYLHHLRYQNRLTPLRLQSGHHQWNQKIRLCRLGRFQTHHYRQSEVCKHNFHCYLADPMYFPLDLRRRRLQKYQNHRY